MKLTFGLLCLIASTMSYASQTVTLEDGRQVQLNDDFTWQYISASDPVSINESETTLPAQVAIPVIEKKTATVVQVNNDKPTMQLSDSGVEVLLGAAKYQSGQLIIPTSLTNQSSQSVVLVEIEVELITASANTKQNVKIWTSIKRLADTYLRPQQVVIGKPISFDVEKEEHYQINAQIMNVETR